MNPAAIAVVFILFWLVIGLGLFLSLTSLALLSRSWGTMGVRTKHRRAGPPGRSRGWGLHIVVALLGLALVYAGGYATYTVIYR